MEITQSKWYMICDVYDRYNTKDSFLISGYNGYNGHIPVVWQHTGQGQWTFWQTQLAYKLSEEKSGKLTWDKIIKLTTFRNKRKGKEVQGMIDWQ